MNADEIVKAMRRIREVRIFGNDQTQLMADAADLIESLQSQLAAERVKYAELQRYNVDCTKQFGMLQMDKVNLQNLLTESQRRERAAVEERDTMMRRHSNQVEVIRQRIDAGWLTCEESWLLSELMFETRYDRRGPQAGKGEAK